METRLSTKLLALLVMVISVATPQPFAEIQAPLRVSENSRFLVQEDGSVFFPIVDTAWGINRNPNRDEVEEYLRRRKEQGFNAIAIIAFPGFDLKGRTPNVYGDYAFENLNNGWNPLKPITTAGNNPENPSEYDYWDHLEYIIDTAESKGMFIVLLPAWGSYVAGDWGDGHATPNIIFNPKSAYAYAQWLGQRMKSKQNIIWMIGGDRSAVYGERDYRSVFRAMAEGVADGVNGVHQQDGQADYTTTLMSYHPRKWKPNSSEWFHDDPWMDFNSIQDQPSDQVSATDLDYSLSPTKPTWLFEGGYEYRKRGKGIYTDWQIRSQSYQTIFAGGFGVTYGSMNVFHFKNDAFSDATEKVAAAKSTTWKSSLEEPGAMDMQHLFKLMTSISNKQFLDRIPDQGLIDGDAGGMEGWEGIQSNRLQATRGAKGDYAMIYSANGRTIRVNMDRLLPPLMDAYWFNPRNGKWRVNDTDHTEMSPFVENIPSGPAAAVRKFDPPGQVGDGNDWVLVLSTPE